MTLRSISVHLVLVLVLGAAACRGGSRGGQAAGVADAPGLGTPCRMALAPITRDGPLGADIAALQAQAATGALRAMTLERLGYALVARARLTGDAGLYETALQAAACLAAESPGNVAADLLRGHVLHQQHRFREAESVARAVVAVRGAALDYGLLGDALLEQGRLEEAGRAYQRMIDLKPFYQSYTRAAHLRWLRGDVKGATETIRLAVSAASPRDPEAGPWARTRLAFYELQSGQLRAAGATSDLVLRDRPDHAPALLVRARVRLAERRVTDAIADLRRAVRADPHPEARWLLADTLRLAGAGEEAARIEADLDRDGALLDARTYALFLATRRKAPDTAVALAERELGVRGDVFTHDALAWALASAGRIDDARAHMTRALAAGTDDARLYLHAAAIAAASDRHADARRWAGRARARAATLLPSERDLLDTLE